jgi:antitoxin MazE
MKSKIIRIGNSRGIRIPKPLLEQLGLDNDVEITAEKGAIVIRAAKKRRAGWAKAFREMAKNGDDQLLDPPTPTIFDETEWEW